jgi:outer membrane protein
MNARAIALTLILAMITQPLALAQEPLAPADPPLEAAPVDAAPAIEAEVAPVDTTIGLTFEESIIQAEPPRSIQEEISVDLIDLQALENVIQNQPGYEPVRLSLDECIRLALEQNDDILVAEVDPLRADADIFAARGEFDPILQGKFNYLRALSTANQQIQLFGGLDTIATWNTQLTGAIIGKTPYGQQYGIQLDVNKEEGTYGGFIEEFDTMMTLSLTQPLLKGFGKKANTFRILAAKNARGASEHQLRLTVMNTTAEVIRAYWDLVGAVEGLRVRRQSLANAERLLQISDTRREIGTAADIEVLQAKAGVATRQSELIAARSQVATASDALKRITGLRSGDLFSTAIVVPTDRPLITEFDEAEIEHASEAAALSAQRALQNRPELMLAEIEIENSEIDSIRARNEMLPQLDLMGTYGTGGRNHKLRDSLIGITDKENYAYTVGINGQVSLGNRAARGAYQRSKLTTRQAELRLEKMRQDILFNVSVAARSLITNKILVESNRQASRLQQANVVAEEKRLRLGVTTSYQVLQVQEDLTMAETQLVQAMIAYEKARVDLLLAEGTILDETGLSYAMPDSEKPIGYINSVTPRWAPDDESRKEYWQRKGNWVHDPHLPQRPGVVYGEGGEAPAAAAPAAAPAEATPAPEAAPES